MSGRISLTIVLDFMCPWSFIGLRSLTSAQTQFEASSGLLLPPIDVSILPYEFDPPGTYPPEGKDWTGYCEGDGPAKASYLLGEKLPLAFSLGKELGIDFDIKRRIVGTEGVNAALVLAQQHGAGLAFALRMLSLHFEELRDPNDEALLRQVLVDELAVPASEEELLAALRPSAARARGNAELTERGRALCGGSVPKFIVSCTGEGGEGDGVGGGSPTSPEYFTAGFRHCVERMQKDEL